MGITRDEEIYLQEQAEQMLSEQEFNDYPTPLTDELKEYGEKLAKEYFGD